MNLFSILVYQFLSAYCEKHYTCDSLLSFLWCTSVVNIAATALVTEAATAIFGEAGVSAATGVMTVCTNHFYISSFQSYILILTP